MDRYPYRTGFAMTSPWTIQWRCGLALMAVFGWSCTTQAQSGLTGARPEPAGPSIAAGSDASGAPDDPGPGPPGSILPPLPANAPEPNPDPRNFDGAWYFSNKLSFQIREDLYGYKTPLNELGKKILARRVKSIKDGTPFINATSKCIPMGQPRQMDLPAPFVIFQTKDRIDMLFQEYHGRIQISLDPSQVPLPGYMGSSVAHWDGNTLVVETKGFRDALRLDANGTPLSTNATLTQRIRKVKTDHWFLEVVFTVDDPTYYNRPWSWIRDYSWRPDMALLREYNCEVSTGAKDGIDPSLSPEPTDE